MKVLFVSAGDNSGKPKPVVFAQGESLRREGIDIIHFCIDGRGISGYLKAVPLLKRKVRESHPDLIHAHYSLSGIVASLAYARPLVVSLMGSDVNGRFLSRSVSRVFARFLWRVTVVKSDQMKNRLGLAGVRVIPNGVDTSLFFERDHDESLRVTGLQPGRKIILFPGDPARREKNWKLAVEAMALLNDPLADLVPLYGRPADTLPYWYSAATAMLSVSLWEGSPNMIKEALACNLPVVATPAGDIPWLIEGVEGCSLTGWSPSGVAASLRTILDVPGRCEGMKRIEQLQLGSDTVARKITDIYNGRLQM